MTTIRAFAVILLAAPVIMLNGIHQSNAMEPSNDKLALTTERVVVFKDGYYLAIKHGSAMTTKDGELTLEDVPDAAVLGSMWATSVKGKLLGMVAGRAILIEKSTEKEVPCLHTLEVMQANLGKQAKVVLTDKTIVHGTVRVVLSESTSQAPTPTVLELFQGADAPHSDLAGSLPARSVTPAITVSGIAGSQFVLNTDDGDMLLSTAQVASLTIKDVKTTLARENAEDHGKSETAEVPFRRRESTGGCFIDLFSTGSSMDPDVPSELIC